MCVLNPFLGVSRACLRNLGVSHFRRPEILKGPIKTSDFVKFCLDVFLDVEFQIQERDS